MLHNSESKSNYLIYFLFISSFALYILISYFTKREDSFILLPVYSCLFFIYLGIYRLIQSTDHIKLALYFSIIFRVALLLLIPNLSDDFYRFIWDGRLINEGINPFVHLPNYYIENLTQAPEGITKELYDKLNSKEYFTIYPPVNQFVFMLAALISPKSILGSVLVMRVLIIAAEVGSIVLIGKLLGHYQLNPKNVLLYALNPLVILELSGSLHFEAIAIFFLLLAVWAWEMRKKLGAAFYIALSICTKLIPLIFLPLFLTREKFKKVVFFYLIVGGTIVLLFVPLLNADFINGLTSSFSLYFQKFEFNAGIYYIIREIGYFVKGYNIIQTAGKYLALATFISIITFTFFEGRKKHNLPTAFFWVYFLYLIFVTTLHPWYVVPLVAFSVFTNFRFPVLWSGLIFFTYLNYLNGSYHENLWVVGVEYIATFGFLIFELIKRLPGRKLKLV
ncbi:glycosyltransferase 87 family protein [Fulvivirgaceae bacterium BMA10]|uniref:Glycosyltransferase 87 family protein n=1 Tax=Splendidivirga corallicola TaxID=3051826 RepID=A0ABT8KWP3_9BACT|nr:glycosyltransferase 87 family protein [Fulvivirgaceae bacterium BMA10]